MLRRILLCAAAAIVVSGCAAENLYVTHRTVVGVNAAVNADQTKGHLVVGYKRRFLTVAPKSVDDEAGEKEAMSVLSCSELEVDGIRLSKFVEQLATGKAARMFAEQLRDSSEENGVDIIFGCWEQSDDGT